ncbi:nectin-3-like [Gopherus evgoodei]|uniref:nectin-3-like n=1 Tax=Gopherus evgoodei TaxID=1825980 RepID=UPI0011CFE5C5|nr:nectin-3-like [Gopherus evgoodei]
MGSCACNSGYKGENCEEADCLDPACSSHGVCVHGRCHCNPEWCGSNCEMLKTMCPDQCSGHGMYLQESDTCTCDPNWTGVDCSNEICPVDCGSHGVCMGGTCHCEKGWTGPACNQRAYHPRCAEHGTCECSQRRNGKRSAVLAKPVVERHVTAVWGKNVTLKCMIEISGTIIQISWEKIHGKSKQTIAVLHPEEGFAPQREYQGRVSLKNNSLTDATIILHNISFSDSGEYVCKAVTFPLGNTESSTTVTVLDAPEVSITGYDGNWFFGRERVWLRCNANANPPPTDFTWTRLDGQWPEGLMSSNNTLHFNHPLTYNYAGTYVCKVTNSLGQTSDQKTIYILDPPTATTRPPMLPLHPSTDGIRALTTEPELMHFPTSTLSSFIAGNQGTIIANAVCGALFLILVSVLVGVICYRRRWTVCGYCFARNYIPPSDMQEESQIDVLHSDDVGSHPDSIKKEIKHPVNSPTSKDLEGHLEDNPEWNNLVNTNRSNEGYERPMEDRTLGRKDMGGECYNDNEDDNPEWKNLVSFKRFKKLYERPLSYYEGGTLRRKDKGGKCYDDNEEDNPEWDNLVNIKRSQEQCERPMDYYEGGTLRRKDMSGECYDDNGEDFVLHGDGSIESRRELYV